MDDMRLTEMPFRALPFEMEMACAVFVSFLQINEGVWWPAIIKE